MRIIPVDLNSEDDKSVLHIAANIERPMDGVEMWRNPNNGFLIVDLDFRADPSKRSQEWIAQSQSGVPKAEWKREFGKDWVVYEGKPVYQDYDDDFHKLVGAIVAPRRARLISGWDGGPNDVNLAWCLGLCFPYENAVIWIDEYTVDDGDIPTFVDVVASRIQLEWAKLGGFSLHVADNSVFTDTKVVKGGKSMADVMRAQGMAPIPGEISYGKRRSAVSIMMKQLYKHNDGNVVPKWRVHERCTFLREAMRGGYAYPRVMGGIGGEYRPAPMKNKFSHIANAMEYACSKLHIADMDIPFEGRALPARELV